MRYEVYTDRRNANPVPEGATHGMLSGGYEDLKLAKAAAEAIKGFVVDRINGREWFPGGDGWLLRAREYFAGGEFPR